MPGSSSHVISGTRRLAAIMSADIAGYSRLMGQDEEGTHARMTRYRRDIILPTVAEHNGEVIKHLGDGFLAVFDSPLEAVRCAIVIQQSIAARNAGIGKQHWLRYRIGLNLGDIIVEDDDIFGDGVNVAARLQTAAEPGGVNISGGVYEQVKNKLVCGYQSLGDEKLKNITDPVRIYKVLPDPAAIGRARTPVGALLRFGIPVVAACLIAFAGGIWFSARQPQDHPAATVAAVNVSPDPGSSAAPLPGNGPSEAQTTSPGLGLGAAAPTANPAANLPTNASVTGSPSESLQKPAQPESAANDLRRVAAVAPPATLPPTPASNVFRDCPTCPEMVKLPGGTFTMGSSEDWSEKPVHQASVTPFAMGRLPVTVGEWRACVAAKACKYEPTGDDDLPVHNVSWDDAQQYAAWLAKLTSKPYRLPSEAEWEYAARAGSTAAYWWGAQVSPGYANCNGCGGPYDPAKPIKVGLLRANAFGLHDMAGGVDQWVSDCWHSTYHGAPRTGSWDAPNCRERVLRGGSWKSDPSDVKVTSRARYDSGVRYPTHGFRVALSEK